MQGPTLLFVVALDVAHPVAGRGFVEAVSFVVAGGPNGAVGA